MKTLILVRHGKSSWKDIGINDHDRPLNNRGERDVPFMAKIISKKGINPDLLISSTAVRAIATAKGFAQELGYERKKIITLKQLYLAELDGWLDAIHEIPDKENLVMAFGHNPGITNLVNFLTKNNIENLPTCGICSMIFKTDSWIGVEAGRGRLDFFDYPGIYLKD
ncbi:MAG: histidine phosphatase family protein [Chitinophagales bacterium]|nr:histidine phosphatase family protein [Chitinophagales bacterium]